MRARLTRTVWVIVGVVALAAVVEARPRRPRRPRRPPAAELPPDAAPDAAPPDAGVPDAAPDAGMVEFAYPDLTEVTAPPPPPRPGLLRRLGIAREGHARYRGVGAFFRADAAGRPHEAYRNEFEARLKLTHTGRLTWVVDASLLMDDGGYHRPLYPLETAADDPRVQDFLQVINGRQTLRPLLAANDLYLQVNWSRAAVAAGIQTITWGKGDLWSPLDRVNPRDLMDPTEQFKIGVLALKGDVATLDGRLEVVFIPFFVAGRGPLPEQRFAPVPPDLGIPGAALATPTWYDDSFPEEAQVCARASRSLRAVDLAGVACHALGQLPSARVELGEHLTPEGTPVLDLTTIIQFERVWLFGLEAATALSGWGLPGWLGGQLRRVEAHAEVAFEDSTTARRDDYVQYVVGLSYRIPQVVRGRDGRITVEYLDEWVLNEHSVTGTEDALRALGPETAAAVEPALPYLARYLDEVTTLDRSLRGSLGAHVEVPLSDPLALELVLVWQLRTPSGYFARPTLRWTRGDLELGLAVDLFGGYSRGLLGGYERDDRVVGWGKVTF